MRYHWIECPGCSCQVAVNSMTAPGGGVTGSLRRWSVDRSINDGRPIVNTPTDALGGFTTACVCGQLLVFGATADAVGSGRDD
ncbi:MAG TPA: hypothetical protein VIZ58_00230 [Thermoanaerobaculia bacterium]